MKIFIKGFKSISQGQYVAIGKKLTFLVDPNSAGKSVVYHALSKLQTDKPLFGLDTSSLHYNGTRDECALQQSLGVEWRDQDDVLESRVTYLLDPQDEEIENTLMDSRLRLDQIYCSGLYDDHSGARSWVNVLKIKNGKMEHESLFNSNFDGVVRAENRNRKNILSFSHSYITDIVFLKWNYEIFKIDDEINNKIIFSASDFVLKIAALCTAIENLGDIGKLISEGLKKDMESGFFSWDPMYIKHIVGVVSEGAEKQQLLNQFFHHDAAIKRQVEKLANKYSSKNPLRNLRLILVSADRILPNVHDVHCTVDNIVPQNIYHALARSFVERDWGFNYVDDQPIGNHPGGVDNRGELANRVNEALANELFIDNGYQINVLSSLILPRVGVDNFLKNNGKLSGGRYNAKIELNDSHGRTLGFDQVGSGIGYVLPVLVETLNSRNAGAMVFLQQPELHLHPAMQASLSDVLIDAASDKCIVVETHSEHMILRTLKRIRQTFNETLIDKKLQLTYEDVAVNYFEPQGDGTTKVHIIRVAPDGEFIDRWPHGFFPERDQELFDE